MPGAAARHSRADSDTTVASNSGSLPITRRDQGSPSTLSPAVMTKCWPFKLCKDQMTADFRGCRVNGLQNGSREIEGVGARLAQQQPVGKTAACQFSSTTNDPLPDV